MKRAGMSQTLGLIIGASVFMMAALTLIIMFEGGVMSAADDVDAEACNSAINTYCSQGIDRVPGSCVNSDDRIIQGAQGLPSGQDTGNIDSFQDIAC